MRKFLWLAAVGVSVLAIGACRAKQPAPEFRTLTSIGEIMKSLVEPSADELWNSVATIVTIEGTEERAPKTDEEWEKLRNHAVSVMEAMNLVIMDGRKAALPGAKSENPGIELEPAEIEKLIADDRPALYNLARKEQDAAQEALISIDKKDKNGLLDAGEHMDTACENCHLKYWYPNDPAFKKPAGPTVKKP